MSGSVDYAEAAARLARFPLTTAISGRRSRRFGLGSEIPSGPLAHRSAHPPLPLDPVERSLLVLAGAGVTGWSTGIEHSVAVGPDALAPYATRLGGRGYPSAAGFSSTELLVTDDDGTFITRFRDLAPGALDGLAGDDLAGLPGRLEAHVARLDTERIAVPREVPSISAHNVWNANQSGSTLLIPVADLAEQALGLLFVALGAGVELYDVAGGTTVGDLSRLGLADRPARGARQSLADFEQSVVVSAAIEIGTAANTITLLLQALGLGGWAYSGIDPTALLGGAGFRVEHPAEHPGPNVVGLAEHFETFSPPWHDDVAAAVHAFVERKFGAAGTYAPGTPGPFRDGPRVHAAAERPDEALVDAVISVAERIHATSGRFPGSASTAYARFYAQAQHVDPDFYDAHYEQPGLLDSHREHLAVWHGQA